MRNRLATFTYVTRQPNILGSLLCPCAKTKLRLYKEFSDNIIFLLRKSKMNCYKLLFRNKYAL